MTRAKVKLVSITHTQYGQRLRFETQYDSSIPEDQRFQKATPSGFAEFRIDNPKALEMFRLIGESFYIDFSQTPPQ